MLFKKSKPTETTAAETANKKEVAEKKAAVVTEKPVKKDKKAIAKKDLKVAFAVLVNPLISEKASLVQESGKYLFEVKNSANKVEIAKAIEEYYNVQVSAVNIINEKPERVHYGRHESMSSGRKKAVVTLKKGSKIEA